MKTLGKLSDWEVKALVKLHNSFMDKRWSSDGIVSMLKLIEENAKLQKVSSYAKSNSITPQGARKFRNSTRIDGVTFIVGL